MIDPYPPDDPYTITRALGRMSFIFPPSSSSSPQEAGDEETPSSGTARVPGAQPSAAEVDVTPANLDRLADPQAGLEEEVEEQPRLLR
jgi:hypothetical protein